MGWQVRTWAGVCGCRRRSAGCAGSSRGQAARRREAATHQPPGSRAWPRRRGHSAGVSQGSRRRCARRQGRPCTRSMRWFLRCLGAARTRRRSAGSEAEGLTRCASASTSPTASSRPRPPVPAPSAKVPARPRPPAPARASRRTPDAQCALGPNLCAACALLRERGHEVVQFEPPSAARGVLLFFRLLTADGGAAVLEACAQRIIDASPDASPDASLDASPSLPFSPLRVHAPLPASPLAGSPAVKGGAQG
jgi:hypothetical protein